MKRLTFVALAATMSIWGLASISRGGARDGSHHEAFSTQTQKAVAPLFRMAARLPNRNLGHDL